MVQVPQMHLTHLNLGLVSFPPKTIHSPGFLSQWLASRGPDQKSKLPFRCFSPSHGTCQQLGSWSSQLAGSPAATPRRLPRRPQPLLCGCLSGLLIDPPIPSSSSLPLGSSSPQMFLCISLLHAKHRWPPSVGRINRFSQVTVRG